MKNTATAKDSFSLFTLEHFGWGALSKADPKSLGLNSGQRLFLFTLLDFFALRMGTGLQESLKDLMQWFLVQC